MRTCNAPAITIIGAVVLVACGALASPAVAASDSIPPHFAKAPIGIVFALTRTIPCARAHTSLAVDLCLHDATDQRAQHEARMKQAPWRGHGIYCRQRRGPLHYGTWRRRGGKGSLPGGGSEGAEGGGQAGGGASVRACTFTGAVARPRLRGFVRRAPARSPRPSRAYVGTLYSYCRIVARSTAMMIMATASISAPI